MSSVNATLAPEVITLVYDPEEIIITIDDVLLNAIMDNDVTLGGDVVVLGGESVTFGSGG